MCKPELEFAQEKKCFELAHGTRVDRLMTNARKTACKRRTRRSSSSHTALGCISRKLVFLAQKHGSGAGLVFHVIFFTLGIFCRVILVSFAHFSIFSSCSAIFSLSRNLLHCYPGYTFFKIVFYRMKFTQIVILFGICATFFRSAKRFSRDRAIE